MIMRFGSFRAAFLVAGAVCAGSPAWAARAIVLHSFDGNSKDGAVVVVTVPRRPGWRVTAARFTA